MACGDTVENINQTGMDVVASVDDLPQCNDKNEGDVAFVKDVGTTFICVDGDWVATNPEGSAASDFSCKTVELKDKSGLKIVCNGDSIGVVLNGSDGKAGKDGKDGEKGNDGEDGKDAVLPQDTLEADSERTAISLDSIVGLTQKGPFLKGSTVYLYELSDGRTLKQTNGNFTSNITTDNGRYKFSARDLVSQYAMVVVDGNYRNEVTGVPSNAPIRLKAITDMRKRSSVNVNLLTHMEFDRVYHLVTRGDKDGKKLTVKKAKQQAQKEILKQFHIELDDNADAEDMDVFGKTDADAALLAVSVLLQGDSNETALTVLLTEISNAIEEKGEWNDSATKARLADWALKADTENRLTQFRNNVSNWHLSTTVPDFEKFIRNYVEIETGLGVCGSEENSIGTFAHIPNIYSAYYAESYESTDPLKNSLVRVICTDKGGNHWRIATALERDTKDWADTTEGAVKKGSIDRSRTYVFENGEWRHGTNLDRIVGFGCTRDMAAKDSVYKESDEIWYNCADTTVIVQGTTVTSAWHIMSDLEKDTVFWKSKKSYTEDSYGELLKGPFTGMTMTWDADTLRKVSKSEIVLGRACVYGMYYGWYILSNTLQYTCSIHGWSTTGKFIDRRDDWEEEYRGVLIGEQTWMADNLRYRYLAGTKDFDSSSFCYDENIENCHKYGRLYLWSAAMDSAGVVEGNTANHCGFGTTCTAETPVRGVCPEGWHLPSIAEWNTLLNEMGGSMSVGPHIKSQSGWAQNSNNVDDYYFSALPAGVYAYGIWDDIWYYREENYATNFWTSTPYREDNSNDNAYSIMIWSSSDGINNAIDNRKNGFSIRCVKDD